MTQKISRTEQTVNRYLNLANQLELAARKELVAQYPELVSATHILPPLQFASWIESRRSERLISKATFRQYKAAVLCYLEWLPETNEVIDAIDYLRAKTNDGSSKSGIKRRASAKKAKHIKPDDLSKLLQYLDDRNGKWDTLISLWLRCSIWTGLRPKEWESARLITLDNQDLGLLVRNAKATNGRSHGEFRTVPLAHLSAESLANLEQFLGLLESLLEHHTHAEIQKKCKDMLYTANRACFPRRSQNVAALYTGRHQFSANAKASDASKKTLAALMGHAIDTTAGEHYARRSSGNVTPNLYALDSEMERVREGDPNPFMVEPEVSTGLPLDII